MIILVHVLYMYTFFSVYTESGITRVWLWICPCSTSVSLILLNRFTNIQTGTPASNACMFCFLQVLDSTWCQLKLYIMVSVMILIYISNFLIVYWLFEYSCNLSSLLAPDMGCTRCVQLHKTSVQLGQHLTSVVK